MCYLLSYRDFEFKKTFQFRLIQKYSEIISDWEVFRNDTLSIFQHEIDDILSHFDSRKFGKLFTPRMGMLQVFTNLLNQVGCKSVLAQLFFCHRIFGKRQKCQMCTRLICRFETHSRILTDLNSVYLFEVMSEAPGDLKGVFELPGAYIPLNCFIDHRKIVNGVVSEGEQNI